MKIKEQLLLLVLLSLTLTSCVALEAPKRWVDDENVFYSSSNPTIKIKINDDFAPDRQDGKSGTTHSTNGDATLANQNALYVFNNYGWDKEIRIQIQSSSLGGRWTFHVPDFTNDPNVIISGKKVFLDNRYATGVFPVEQKRGNWLVKVYSRLAAQRTYLRIIYAEKIEGKWGERNDLSQEQLNYAHNFSNRADLSFELLPYEISTVKNSMQLPTKITKDLGSEKQPAPKVKIDISNKKKSARKTVFSRWVINIYDTPSFEGTKLGRVSKNELLVAMFGLNGWLEVTTDSGVVGWVSGEALYSLDNGRIVNLTGN